MRGTPTHRHRPSALQLVAPGLHGQASAPAQPLRLGAQAAAPGGDSGRSHADIWVGHLCTYRRPRQTPDALEMNGVSDPAGAVGGVCVCVICFCITQVFD